MSKQPYNDDVYIQQTGDLARVIHAMLNVEGNDADTIRDAVESAIDNYEEE